MIVTTSTIITAAAVIAALIALGRYFTQLHNWYLKQGKQDKAIKAIKREQTMITYALSACLDGLHQLGANSSVSEAKDKLDKYINQQAHDQLDDEDE